MSNLSAPQVDDLPIVASFLPTALASALALTCGILAIASNPRRRANILFLTISVHISVWLLTRGIALPLSQVWIRIATFISGCIPLHLWILTAAMLDDRIGFYNLVKNSKWWILLTILLGATNAARYFLIPISSLPGSVSHLLFYLSTLGLACMYISIYLNAKLKGRSITGNKKVEIDIIIAGGSISAIMILAMTVVSFLIGRRINLQPIVISLFYSLTVFAVTTHRVLDTRQLIIFCLTRIVSLAALAVFSYTAYLALLCIDFPDWLSFFLSIAASGTFAVLSYNRWMDWFRLIPDSSAVIADITELSRVEYRRDRLESGFIKILGDWLGTDALMIWWVSSALEPADSYKSQDIPIRSFKNVRWTSSERLLREKSSYDNCALSEFLGRYNLDFASISEGPTHSVIIGAARQRSGSPYTYPLIKQIIATGIIIEMHFERSYFIAKVQEAEQFISVGLIGANLAHEIRNPLVSIKTFIQLLEKDEGFAIKSRFIAEVKDELERIDKLAKQLINISRPKLFNVQRISLVEVIKQVNELLQPEITTHKIELKIGWDDYDSEIWTDHEGCKQVLLNLCRNSIQALTDSEGKKEMKIAVSRHNSYIKLNISDNGPGIANSIRDRLFEPFQSTKPNGFGLGLSICRDILKHVGASISVEDETKSTGGATFAIYFPRTKPV